MKQLLNNLSLGGQIAFYIITFVAIALLLLSFFCPPLGIIDNSALMAVGECFAFASLSIVLVAINKGIGATVQHNGTSVTIEKPEKEEKD